MKIDPALTHLIKAIGSKNTRLSEFLLTKQIMGAADQLCGIIVASEFVVMDDEEKKDLTKQF